MVNCLFHVKQSDRCLRPSIREFTSGSHVDPPVSSLRDSVPHARDSVVYSVLRTGVCAGLLGGVDCQSRKPASVGGGSSQLTATIRLRVEVHSRWHGSLVLRRVVWIWVHRVSKALETMTGGALVVDESRNDESPGSTAVLLVVYAARWVYGGGQQRRSCNSVDRDSPHSDCLGGVAREL